MRLSLHTDYSLRVLMYLAARARRSTVAEIARFFAISRDHVAKVVQRLARLGYLRSMRGVGGGLELARDADAIRIGQVILDVEGSMQLLECVHAEQQVCVIQPNCRLRGVLARAEQIQLDFLQSVRLSDLITAGEPLVSLTTTEHLTHEQPPDPDA